jgi:hypothetical protein
MSPDELRAAIEAAFDYRGDARLTLRSGEVVEGYLFDRRIGATPEDSYVRVIPRTAGEKRNIACADIMGLELDARDPAAGKSWEAWVRKYWEKKAAGETDIALHPEALD